MPALHEMPGEPMSRLDSRLLQHFLVEHHFNCKIDALVPFKKSRETDNLLLFMLNFYKAEG